VSRDPGVIMEIVLLAPEPAERAHQNRELRTEEKYNTDLRSDVFDLRVALRFIQTRRDRTENVERTIASSFWRAAATLVGRRKMKRRGSAKQLRFVQTIKSSPVK
jgi:hypothetical protein